MNELDQEEQEILQALEAGEIRRVPDFAESMKWHRTFQNESQSSADQRYLRTLSQNHLAGVLPGGIPAQDLPVH